MKKQIKQVLEFQKAFGQGVRTSPSAYLDKDKINLRYRLMREENKEYLIAATNGDLTGIADALGDKLYVLFGTIIEHGMQDKIVEVFDEIHRSNMSKLGEDGQPIFREDGKVLKGQNYSPPNLKDILIHGI